MIAKIVSIANQKGGVGKTASTINLAHTLTQAGQRVLMIDGDPQSSLSIAHGVDPKEIQALDYKGKTLYYGLAKDIPLTALVISGQPALIPASIRLANAETELASPFGAATILKEKLAQVATQFDFILIDCPPTLSLLTVNALTASHTVLIPCKTDYLSIMGIPLLIETIENVRRRANPKLEILGILPTLYNARASHDAEVLNDLRSATANKKIPVLEPVNRSTVFDKANFASKPAIALYPKSPGISQYQLIAQQLISAPSAAPD